MSFKNIKIVLILIIVCLTMMASGVAMADDEKDIKALTKAIGFIQGGPTGEVDVAVVFDPTNRDSSAHADAVIDIARSYKGSNKVKFSAKKISYANIEFVKSKIIFITRGMEGKYDSILNKAIRLNAITVSTDENCLNKGGCVLIVKTDPDVDILVNTAVAARTGTEFSSAFSMMITKR